MKKDPPSGQGEPGHTGDTKFGKIDCGLVSLCATAAVVPQEKAPANRSMQPDR